MRREITIILIKKFGFVGKNIDSEKKIQFKIQKELVV